LKPRGVLFLATLAGMVIVGFDAAASGTMPQLAQAQPAAQPPGNAIRLQLAKIMDPNGFERPMVAVTGLVPAGWQTRGGVVWNTQSGCGNGYQFDWTAASPDGRMAAAVFPGMQWGFNNFDAAGTGGCPTLRIGNVQQYLQFLVQQSRPNARILDFRRHPDVEQEYRQVNRTTPMPLGEVRTWVEAGEVLIGYSDQGSEVRESATAAVIFSVNRMQGAYVGQTQAMESVTGVGLPGFAFRAPNGQLDLRLAETIRKSLKPTPEWSARISQHNAKISRMNIEGARKRSQITAQTSKEIMEMNRRSYEERNRIMDRQQREVSESIRDVETYNDPKSATGTVELSNQYQNAWRLDDGTYVLSDQPDFNPYAVYGQGATRLERTQ
jgi:hypothetical protein